MEMLAESFVVAKQKGPVLADRSSECATELIPRESWHRRSIKEVARIEGAVAQVFVQRTMELVGAGAGNDEHLRTGTLAVLGGVRITQHVELAHGIHAE